MLTPPCLVFLSSLRLEGLQWPMTHLQNTQEKFLVLTFNNGWIILQIIRWLNIGTAYELNMAPTLHDANLFWHILIIVMQLCPSHYFFLIVQ